ncbi:hypothetical protein FAF44_35010 [Nonomuraea sp. MG754425]|uniref:hypothetical protein n=1 Tax=Nonomuraea sp. MG754425 TaxID=2570319 RepID=UPI001F30D990|nr:hypothetical protein [Nonomuraea sp. MG754425]MCF6473559.1 hypothetical protein [Nonomuraea sp. MG754425]
MSADVLALQRLGASRAALHDADGNKDITYLSGWETRGNCMSSSAACCNVSVSNFVYEGEHHEQRYGARITTLTV